MPLPLQVTFRGLSRSEAVEARVRAKVDKLEQLFERITACRVVIEAPHQHHHKGRIYSVSVDVSIPDGSNNHAHEDVYVALRDAFDSLGRRLREHARRARGDVKRHTTGRRHAGDQLSRE
jgi:ribosomal subunit interface protein